MTSIAFAKAAGCSPKTLRRYINAGFIEPARRVQRGKGRKKSYRIFFRRTQIAEMKRALDETIIDAAHADGPSPEMKKSGYSRPKDSFSGEEAGVVFKMLDEGSSVREIVKVHRIHPDAVVEIQKTYARVDGGLYLSRATLDTIAALPLDGPLPVEKEADLVDVLRIASTPKPCVLCKKEKRAICKDCLTAKTKEAGEAREQAIFAAAKAEHERQKAEAAAPANGAAKPNGAADVELPDDESPGLG